MRRILDDHISYVDKEPPSEKVKFNKLWNNITKKFKLIRTEGGVAVYAPPFPVKLEKNYLYVLSKSKVDIDINLEDLNFKGGISVTDKYNFGNRYIFPIDFTPASFWDGGYDFKICLKRDFAFYDIVRIKRNNSKHKIVNFTVDGKLILDNGKIVESEDVYYYDSEIKTHISIMDKIKNYFRILFH